MHAHIAYLTIEPSNYIVLEFVRRSGSESDTLPLHHHHLPVRIRILLHHTHVAAQSASQTEALPQTGTV